MLGRVRPVAAFSADPEGRGTPVREASTTESYGGLGFKDG